MSYLKNKGWALSLSAGAGSDTKEYGMATIKIGLTPKGLEEYKEVLKTTLNYIELMKTSGYQTHVYNELKSMAELEYVYGSKGEGMWRATQLANEAMMYPLKDAGKINYIYRKDEPEYYESLLKQLTPDNMLVVLTAKGLKTDKIEHHYQAPYSYVEDDSFYKTLIKKESIAGLAIPKENPFIPKSASVPNREIIEGKLPELISEEKGQKLYFGLDHEFLRPKGVINLKILLPKEIMSVNHRVYSKLYSACVNESLNELSYPAKQAGLNYSFREGYELSLIHI